MLQNVNTYFTRDALKLYTTLFVNPVRNFCIIIGINSVVFLANVVFISRLLTSKKVMGHAICGHKELRQRAGDTWR